MTETHVDPFEGMTAKRDARSSRIRPRILQLRDGCRDVHTILAEHVIANWASQNKRPCCAAAAVAGAINSLLPLEKRKEKLFVRPVLEHYAKSFKSAAKKRKLLEERSTKHIGNDRIIKALRYFSDGCCRVRRCREFRSDRLDSAWKILSRDLQNPKTVLVCHRQNHYCLIFGLRSYVSPDGTRHRDVLTAKGGQAPTFWWPLRQCLRTVTGKCYTLFRVEKVRRRTPLEIRLTAKWSAIKFVASASRALQWLQRGTNITRRTLLKRDSQIERDHRRQVLRCFMPVETSDFHAYGAPLFECHRMYHHTIIHRVTNRESSEPLICKRCSQQHLAWNELKTLHLAQVLVEPHPNIVLCKFASMEGPEYYDLYLSDCGHLNLAKTGTLSENDMWILIKQIGSALKHLHRRQIIHGDVKPANIMYDGVSKKAMLLDFNAAHIGARIFGKPKNGSRGKRRLGICERGTSTSASPEMWNGGLCSASDVWGLGVSAFYAMTNRMPFGDEMLEMPNAVTIRVARKQLLLERRVKNASPRFTPVEMRSYSRKLRILVVKMLRKKAIERPSAAEVEHYSS